MELQGHQDKEDPLVHRGRRGHGVNALLTMRAFVLVMYIIDDVQAVKELHVEHIYMQ